jgi:hypothetical protein
MGTDGVCILYVFFLGVALFLGSTIPFLLA